MVTLDLGGADRAFDLIQEAGGKLTIVGLAYSPEFNQDQLVIARVNADGSTDATFGTGGVTRVDFDSASTGGTTALRSFPTASS